MTPPPRSIARSSMDYPPNPQQRRTPARGKSTVNRYTWAMPRRIFVLSPARCDGERAEMMLAPRARFPLAQRLRTTEGAPLGEVMSFLSGLYFRGKLTYAETFARPPARAAGILVITTNAGLQPPS